MVRLVARARRYPSHMKLGPFLRRSGVRRPCGVVVKDVPRSSHSSIVHALYPTRRPPSVRHRRQRRTTRSARSSSCPPGRLLHHTHCTCLSWCIDACVHTGGCTCMHTCMHMCVGLRPAPGACMLCMHMRMRIMCTLHAHALCEPLWSTPCLPSSSSISLYQDLGRRRMAAAETPNCAPWAW